MKSVADVLNTCLDIARPLEALDPLLTEAVGCVLARDILAPFNRPLTRIAHCDGYAVNAQEFLQSSAPIAPPDVHDVVGGGIAAVSGHTISGRVLGTIHSDGTVSGVSYDAPEKQSFFGRKTTTKKRVNDIRLLPPLLGTDMYRVSAGAPLPDDADTVIELEATDMGSDQVRVMKQIQLGENTVDAGADVKANTVILRAGTRIDARQVALLAGVGLLRVTVHPQPRVAVISIGDELIDPSKVAGEWSEEQNIKPKLGQVFDSNAHALSVAIKDLGAQTFRSQPVKDDIEELKRALVREQGRADVIITTGSLSSGSTNIVREVFAAEGNVRFDELAMSPVHHLGYGTYQGIPVFCLPGDPVAAQVAFEIFVRPALRRMAGHKQFYRHSMPARVDRGWTSPAGKREFVRIFLEDGHPKVAHVLGQPGFNSILRLAQANALAVVPEDVTVVKPGDQVFCMSLD